MDLKKGTEVPQIFVQKYCKILRIEAILGRLGKRNHSVVLKQAELDLVFNLGNVLNNLGRISYRTLNTDSIKEIRKSPSLRHTLFLMCKAAAYAKELKELMSNPANWQLA